MSLRDHGIESVQQKELIEDHIAGKGHNSILHYNLVHNFIPIPQAMINLPDAKAAVDKEWKEWKKLETIPALPLEKVRSQKEVIKEAQNN